jgi:hypothetical protein
VWGAFSGAAEDLPDEADGYSRVDGFAGFKLIAERNIFSATRSSRLATPAERPQPRRIETLTLVGTIAYGERSYAFFEGSDVVFHKVLETGGEIADCKVAMIGCSGVTLDAGGQSITLQVGTQLRREENGTWGVAASDAPALAAKAASPSPDDESDTVRRLMLQREQELK